MTFVILMVFLTILAYNFISNFLKLVVSNLNDLCNIGKGEVQKHLSLQSLLSLKCVILGKGEELFRKKSWVDSSSNLELLIQVFASAEALIFPSIIILKPFIDKGNNSYAEQCSRTYILKSKNKETGTLYESYKKPKNYKEKPKKKLNKERNKQTHRK